MPKHLKLIKAEKTSLLADLLGNRGNGVIGFGHFSRFPLRHTLFQAVDSCRPPKQKQKQKKGRVGVLQSEDRSARYGAAANESDRSTDVKRTVLR